MRRLESWWLPYTLLVLAWCLYGGFTESGPVGWINLAQQSIFGAYWLKGSVLAAVLVLMLAGAAVFGVLQQVRGAVPVPSAVTTARPMSRARLLLVVFAGLLAVTWTVGLAACAWFTHRQQADNTASYRAVTLTAGTMPTVTPGERLALRAEALLDHTLVRTAGRDVREHLVPLVAPGWRDGERIAFVVAGGPPGQWQADAPTRGSRRGSVAVTLLVRVGSELSVLPAHEFAAIGAPVDEHNHLLSVVPSAGGRPILQTTDPLQITLWSCGAMSALLAVLGLLSALVVQRQDRQRA